MVIPAVGAGLCARPSSLKKILFMGTTFFENIGRAQWPAPTTDISCLNYPIYQNEP